MLCLSPLQFDQLHQGRVRVQLAMQRLPSSIHQGVLLACRRPAQVFAHSCDAGHLEAGDELLEAGVVPTVSLEVVLVGLTVHLLDSWHIEFH